ncbi:MAG TPA: TIGR03790 family protein [Verrucomicrobiae bacterium]|jgi:uncharacterized protein (TIGR03790 family)
MTTAAQPTLFNRATRWSACWLLLALAVSPRPASAGGSGLNVAIIVNQASSNSVALGNYYAERRQVPPENLLRINWPGGNIEWSLNDFTNVLLNPLLAMLADRGLSNQIDYVVLSMDIPYRVQNPGLGYNSTTAALFYGFKSDPHPPCSLAINSTNSYAGSEEIFRLAQPTSAPGYSFLATMITAETLAQAQRLVDAGVNSDGSFPAQPVILAKTSDWFRNVRYSLFDDAIFDARVRGGYALLRTNTDDVAGFTNVLGFQTGLASFTASSNTFVPGAMADSLTSYGGTLFENVGQTTALEFIKAGAAGSYGTVTEPCNYLKKFPSPQNYFYQARGFSLAECYYQSLIAPYQGILVAEPLAAPFRAPGNVQWIGLASNAVLQGMTNLSLQISSTTTQRPLQQIDLFLDGKLLQTITNISPRENNTITVRLNGRSRTYTVPVATTLKSITEDLATSLNSLPYHNQTLVDATASGDRIVLRSTDTTKTGNQLSASITTAVGSGAVLTTFGVASHTNFLDTFAYGQRSYEITGSSTLGSILQVTVTKTNGTIVTLAATNSSGTISAASHTQQLLALMNAAPALQAADGLVAEDFFDYAGIGLFNLTARTLGRGPAEITVAFVASAGMSVSPAGINALDENLADLQPRNHFYLSAGTTNQTIAFALNTTNLADGFHELTAVAYEGTHVHTQTRATVPVWIQNSALTATLAPVNADTTTAVEAMFTVNVSANQSSIALIELFSTGGRIGAATNQNSASFAINGLDLGAGLHPFYAVVTTAGGQKYRTTNFVTRLVGVEKQIPLCILGPDLIELLWPGIAGRRYDILSADAMSNAFLLRDTKVPINSTGSAWTETNLPPTQTQRFYRVGVSQ